MLKERNYIKKAVITQREKKEDIKILKKQGSCQEYTFGDKSKRP